MSSKGRSDTGDTGEDYYPTPADAILPILETKLLKLPGGIWLEPCAGTGAIVRTINRVRSDVSCILCELDPRVGQHLQALVRPGRDLLLPFGDFVTREWTSPPAAVCIMNPPFGHTTAFARAALERARVVVMLQRNSWFGTQERAPWLRRHCPDQLTLPARPSFRPDGKTDSTEYSWFHWPAGDRRRRRGMLAMLDSPRSGQAALPL